MAPMDAEKRLERVMDRLFDHRSASSPSTPAASSAGRSVSLLNTGRSVNTEKAGLGPQGGYHSPANVVSTSSASEPLCRPWDRGDLFRRLATFKSMSWFGKPQVIGPVSCARRGWVNVDIDMVSCDGCGAHQSFPIPASWSKQQVESAAEDFAKKLETGHKSLCPWKGNECAEGLAQFPPTPLDVLVQGYNDRCEALLKLSALPLISGSAINHMKLSKGPQVDLLLTYSQRAGTGYLSGNWDKEPGADCIKELQEADNAYHQARKLIGLCGWELRLLPYSVDSDDTHEKVCLTNLAQSREVLGPKVSVCLKGGFNQAASCLTESQFTWDPSAALLECKFCGANVGLWNFTKMARPSPAICSIAEEQPEVSPKDSETPLSQTHALSGSDAWSGGEPIEIVRDAPEVIKSTEHCPCPKGVLDLSLTIAGGPPPTQLIYPPSVTATFIPVPGLQPMCRQLESSQMGDWVASQRSREPQEHGHDIGAGESSVSRQNSRLPQTDSVNGIVVDNDGDETDIGVSGRVTTEFRKRKLAEDTSAVDQISPDIAVEEERYAIAGFHKSLDNNLNKRKRQESLHKQSNVQVAFFKDTPVSSSVNAVNTTCYCKMANSAESVEYLPEGSDGHETGVFDKKNEQSARFGADMQANNHQFKEAVEPGSSRSDEGGGEGLGTNVVGLNNDTNIRNVFMNSSSDGIARNHEAAVEGEVNRTEISYNCVPSTAAETERVAKVVDPQVRRNESVNNHVLTGESVPRKISKLVVDTHGDSNEAFVSLSSGHGEASVKAKVLQRECEDHHVQTKKNQHRMQDETNGTIVGLLVSGETGTVEHADAEGPQKSKGLHSLMGKYFAGASEAVNSIEDKCLVWNQEDGSFDPVLQHHHFCPWVNTNSTDISLCGWQSTLDALTALRIKEHLPGGMTVSESTGSKYKVNPLVFVQSLLRGSSFSKNNASC